MREYSDITVILALFLAIHNTAKRYHWQYRSKFGDHLMFDRVADETSESTMDKLIEQYYMGIARDKISELDDLVSLSTRFEGAKFNVEEMSNSDGMVSELMKKCKNLILAIEELKPQVRGIDSTIDEISGHALTCFGLLCGRDIK